MIGQMSKQMDIPRKEAGGLMAKAKKMNESARTISDADRERVKRIRSDKTISDADRERMLRRIFGEADRRISDADQWEQIDSGYRARAAGGGRRISDADRARADRERMAISRAQAGGFKEGGHVVAISVYNVTKGSEDVPVEWGRKKLDHGTEKLIQGTESQVRGRYFNDNDGKGTF